MSDSDTSDLVMTANPVEPAPELIVTFSRPYSFAGVEYTSMRLEEPTAEQLILCDGVNGWEMDVRLVSLVSGLPEVVVRQLKVRDLLPGSRYLGRFLN